MLFNTAAIKFEYLLFSNKTINFLDRWDKHDNSLNQFCEIDGNYYTLCCKQYFPCIITKAFIENERKGPMKLCEVGCVV